MLTPLHPWIAIGATVFVFLAIQLRRGASTDIVFLGGLMMVTLTGVISPAEAFAGFANGAVIAVAGLVAVSAGLRSAGVLDWVGRRLLGNIHSEKGALWRLAAALISSSAFLLNTALVAMMAPMVVEWCRRRRISPSRLLIPVSYLTILGGVCTLIGTSTTLVANGKLRQQNDQWVERLEELKKQPAAQSEDLAYLEQFTAQTRPMHFFELGYVGLPCAIVGAVFMLFVAPRLLANRTDLLEQLGDQRREYLVEMLVRPDCPFVGVTIEEAGLRHLPGLFLIEIDRDGDLITPVAPTDVLHEGDRLIFTGVVSTIVDLEKIPGLTPAADRTFELGASKIGGLPQRHLTEVVLSRTSPLIGSTVRQAKFRQLYGAAVVAVHRNGLRLTNKIGNISLEPGDALLLQTRNDFVNMFRNSRDFYLVSSVEGVEPRRHEKLKLAAILLGLLVAWLVAASLSGEWLYQHFPALASPAVAAITIAGLMIVTGCMRASDARNALDFQMLITIAAALGLGAALTARSKPGANSAAEMIASTLVAAVGQHPYLLLAVIYLLAVLFTEMITNNAVAAMLLPLGIAVAWEAQCNPRPFIFAVALAASLSFVTPIGYQTNLMVMGPGGYRPVDYLRCGLPLAVLVFLTAMLVLPVVWPFTAN